jgi:hypothetical protein
MHKTRVFYQQNIHPYFRNGENRPYLVVKGGGRFIGWGPDAIRVAEKSRFFVFK